MRICNIWQVLFCIYAIKRIQKIHAGVPALTASRLMGAKMPLRRGAERGVFNRAKVGGENPS